MPRCPWATILHEHGVIDDVLAGRRGLAGLRNRRVHTYDEIDDVRVHDALATAVAGLVS